MTCPALLVRFGPLVVALGLLPAGAAAERWAMRYFYDEDRSELTINDLNFPSPERGIAVGYVAEKQKAKPAAVVTSDGGAHWSLAPLKEVGLSLFFLNDSQGWMVTAKGIWQTGDAGRSWLKLPKAPPSLLRVYFLDEQHGWAAGARKSVYETHNGGKTWAKVAAAEEPQTNAQFTSYTWIAFANKEAGMIVGSSSPPRGTEPEFPDWMEPEKAAGRREWPHLSLTLNTRNGGKTWTPSTVSMFGRITRVRLAPNGTGLALIEFGDAFDWPSEVYRLDWKSGKSARVYREKDRAITDIALSPGGPAYLAGVEVTGKLRSPIPRKLKILKSDDLASWKEMDVDYRATAARATLAAADERNIWVATDTGMILKLVH